MPVAFFFHSVPSNPSSTVFPRLERQRPVRKQASSPAGTQASSPCSVPTYPRRSSQMTPSFLSRSLQTLPKYRSLPRSLSGCVSAHAPPPAEFCRPSLGFGRAAPPPPGLRVTRSRPRPSRTYAVWTVPQAEGGVLVKSALAQNQASARTLRLPARACGRPCGGVPLASRPETRTFSPGPTPWMIALPVVPSFTAPSFLFRYHCLRILNFNQESSILFLGWFPLVNVDSISNILGSQDSKYLGYPAWKV